MGLNWCRAPRRYSRCLNRPDTRLGTAAEAIGVLPYAIHIAVHFFVSIRLPLAQSAGEHVDGAAPSKGRWSCCSGRSVFLSLCLFDIERLAMPTLCVSPVADVPTPLAVLALPQ